MSSEVGARLTGDNSEFIAMLGKSAEAAGKFSGDVAGKVAGKLVGMRDVSTAIATALGINITSIAENISRLATGMTKDVEEAYKNLGAASDKLTEVTIANMRILRTDEQNYQIDLQKRDRLLRELATEQAKAVKLSEIGKAALTDWQKLYSLIVDFATQRGKIESANLAVQQAETPILEYQKKLREETNKTIEKSAEIDQKNNDAQNASLIKADDLRRSKLSVETQSKEINAEILTLESRRDELLESHLDASKEIARIDELRGTLAKNALSVQQTNAEIAKLLLSNTGKLSEADRLRLAVLQGQTKEADVQKEIAQIIARAVNGELTPADRERLAVLTNQSAQIKKQLEDLKAQEAVVINISRSGKSYQDQSTAALEGVRDRIKKQLDEVTQKNAMLPRARQDPTVYALQSEYQQIVNEISLRSTIGGFANRFGEDAARAQWGDTLTERAVREVKDEQTQTRFILKDIQERFAKYFPDSVR